jgi:hypothetical protein
MSNEQSSCRGGQWQQFWLEEPDGTATEPIEQSGQHQQQNDEEMNVPAANEQSASGAAD